MHRLKQNHSGSWLFIGYLQAALLMLIQSAACSSSESQSITNPHEILAELLIRPNVGNLTLGQSQTFNVVGIYEDQSERPVTSDLTWSVEPSSLASISSDGTLTTQGLGQIIVYAAYKTFKTGLGVRIVTAFSGDMHIAGDSQPLPVGLTRNLTAVPDIAQQNVTTEQVTNMVSWSSSNPSIMTVGNGFGTKGLITAVAPGNVTISATYGGKTATFPMTVSAAALTSLTILNTPSEPIIAGSAARSLSARGAYSDGSTHVVTNDVTWASSDANTVSVSNTAGSKGQYTSLRDGWVDITASLGSITSPGARIQVVVPTMTSVAILSTPNQTALPLGTTAQLVALATYNNNLTFNITAQGLWEHVGDSNYLQLLPQGAYSYRRARAVGMTPPGADAGRVKFTFGAFEIYTDYLTVIEPQLTALIVSKPSNTLFVDQNMMIDVYGVFTDDSNLQVSSLATFTSSNPSILAVDNSADKGRVTGMAAGCASIAISYLQQTASSGEICVNTATLSSLTLAANANDLLTGEQTQLSVIGSYSDGVHRPVLSQCTFSASDPGIVSVTGNGSGAILTALAAGSTTLTVTHTPTGSQAALDFVVSAPELMSLSLSPNSLNLSLGRSGQLSLIGLYEDGSVANLTAQGNFQIADPLVASVGNGPSNKGAVASLSQGSTQVVASIGLLQASASVTVGPQVVDALSIVQWDPNFPLGTLPPTPQLPFSLPLGLGETFDAIAVWSDSNTTSVQQLGTWSTEDANIITVDSAGNITSLAMGQTTLHASYSGAQAQLVVTVTAPQLSGLNLMPDGNTLFIAGVVNNANGLGVPLGMTGSQLIAYGVYSDGSSADLTQSVTWSADDTNVLTVDSSGIITTLALGSTFVTATQGGEMASLAVTVLPAVATGLAIVPPLSGQATPYPVTLATSPSFDAVVIYSDNSNLSVQSSATWSVDDPNVSTVDNVGQLTTVALGTTMLRAEYGDLDASLSIEVIAAVLNTLVMLPSNPNEVEAASVLGESAMRIPLGATGISFMGQATYTDGSVTPITQQGIWSVDDANILSVDANGLVTTHAYGTTDLRVSYGALQDAEHIIVGPARPSSLSISPANANLPIGYSLPMLATATYTDGSSADYTAQLTWAVDGSGNGAFSSDANLPGYLVGQTAGVVVVTGTDPNSALTEVANITVTTANLVSISVQMADANLLINPNWLNVGSSRRLVAYGTFDDGSVLDLTQQVTWQVDDALTATVSNITPLAGEVSALQAGVVQVAASIASINSPNLALAISSQVATSLDLQPTSANLVLGHSEAVRSIATYDNALALDVSEASDCASSDTDVFTVSRGTDGRCIIKAVGLGTATLTVDFASLSDTLVVTVSGL